MIHWFRMVVSAWFAREDSRTTWSSKSKRVNFAVGQTGRLQCSKLTWLCDSVKTMSVILFCVKAVFAVAEILASFALEPRTDEWIHLTSVAVNAFVARRNDLENIFLKIRKINFLSFSSISHTYGEFNHMS